MLEIELVIVPMVSIAINCLVNVPMVLIDHLVNVPIAGGCVHSLV